MPDQNTSVAKKVVINTFFLTVGQFVTIISGILWTALFARYIGPQTYGIYSYAQSVLAILVILVNFGFDQLLVRDVAKDPSIALYYLKIIVGIKMILALAIFCGLIVLGIVAHWNTLLILTFVLVSLITFVEALVAVSRSELYARQIMHFDTITVILRSVMVLACGVIAIWLKQSFIAILFVVLVVSIVSTSLNYFFSLRAISRIRTLLRPERFSLRNVFGLISRSLPFAALLSISVLYANIMVILIKLITRSDIAVGEFAAAQRIYACVLIVPNMFLQSILPAFSHVFSQSVESFKVLFERSYRFIFILTMPIAVTIWCIAPDIVQLLYGNEYANAGPMLRVLGLGLINGVGFVMGPALMATNRQKVYALIYALALVGVIGASLVLIPRYGSIGACWALVSGTLAGFFVYSYLLYRVTKLRYPLATVIKTVVASLIMACILMTTARYLHFLIATFIAAPIAYFICSLLARTLSIEDIGKLRGVLPRFMHPLMSFWSTVQGKIEKYSSII